MSNAGHDGKVPIVKPSAGSWVLVAIAWLVVGVPLLWGITMTLKKAVLLFR